MRVWSDLLFFGVAFLEGHRQGVDAIAKPGGRGAVVEDVAEVGVAIGAADFGASSAETQVLDLVEAVWVVRGAEAGPAAAGVEFRAGLKDRRVARRAAVHAAGLGVAILAGEGALGAGFAQDVELLGGELFAPIRFWFIF